MYSVENYYWGLLGYYLGSLMVMSFLFRFRGIVPSGHFRNLLLIFIATVLFAPIYAESGSDFLAPAWFASLIEGVSGEPEQSYFRGAFTIFIWYFLALISYILYYRSRSRKLSKRRN
ncbi:MAG: hypothetical protein ACI9LL_000545 [Porticoccus sp.]|jgi:hypothetical protein